MHLYDLDPKPVCLALFYLMNVCDVNLKLPPPQPRSQGVSSNRQRDPDLVWSRLLATIA